MSQTAEKRRSPREPASSFAASSPDAGAAAAPSPAATQPLSGPAALQIVMIWRGQILGYRLLERRTAVTIGPHKRATLITPPVLGGRGRFKLAQPRRGGDGYVVRLAPGMRGDVLAGGIATQVIDLLAGPPPAGRNKSGDVREVTIAPGDRARIQLDERSDLRLELRFVDRPESIGKPRIEDPLLTQTVIGSTIVLGVLAAPSS